MDSSFDLRSVLLAGIMHTPSSAIGHIIHTNTHTSFAGEATLRNKLKPSKIGFA